MKALSHTPLTHLQRERPPQTLFVPTFYSYGFGMFGSRGPVTSTVIGIGIFCIQVVVSTVWLRFFQYGPLE